MSGGEWAPGSGTGASPSGCPADGTNLDSPLPVLTPSGNEMKTLLAEQGIEVTHGRISKKKLGLSSRCSALRASNTWAFQVDFQDDYQGSQ